MFEYWGGHHLLEGICTYVRFILQMSPDCKVIILPKEEVDKANKDKKKHYPPNFQVSR